MRIAGKLGVARALVLVIALTAFPGCGTVRDLATSSGVVDTIEDLPGVRAVELGKRALDDDYFSADLVVDMESGASAEQIAAALDEMAAWAAGVDGGNDEHTETLYVGAGTTEYDDGWMPDGPSQISPGRPGEANLQSARLFLAAEKALDEPVVLFGSRLGAQWRIHSDDIPATVRKVLADPVMAAAPGLVIEGPESRFGSREPLTAALVAAYEQALTTLPRPSGATASVMYFGSPMEGEGFGRKAGRLEIILVIQTRERRPLAQVADVPEGDRFWPAVRSQLDVMRGAPAGSHLMVWLQYDPIGSDFRKVHDLVDHVVGKPVLRIKEPSWNDEAAAYLAR